MTCDILHCNNLTDIVDNNVLVNDCSDEFGSVCSLGCITGYTVIGNDMFTCDIVNADGVEWRNNVTGGDFQCDIGTLLAINKSFISVSLLSNLYRRFGSII